MPKYPGLLKFWGILLIIYALLYAITGALILAGQTEGIVPEFEGQTTLLIIIFFIIALIALIGGIVCIAKKLTAARVIGLILVIWGLYSLISAQLTQDEFNLVSLIDALLGISIFISAKKAETK